IIRNQGAPFEKVTYSAIPKLENDINISKEDMKRTVDRVVFIISILMYPFAVIVSFAYRFLEALLLGGIGLLLSRLLQLTLTYKTMIRLAVVALTPALILTTIAEFFNWSLFYIRLFSLILPVVYMIYAIYAQKDIDQTNSTQKEA